MKNTFHKSILFIGILFTSLSYSQEVQTDKESSVKCEKPCSSWSVVEDAAPCNCGYNCPARINPVCGWDFDVYGDFLYWQAREKDLAPMNHFIITSPNGIRQQKEKIENIDFDYHPAFKVGIGMSTERDNWVFNLEYTRFNATNTKKGEISPQDFNPSSSSASQNTFSNITGLSSSFTSVASPSLLTPTNGSFITARSFDAHWKLNFNTIDLVAGRPYFLGTKLTLSPFYALRGGWIDQHYKLTSISPITTTIAPRTDYFVFSLVKSDSWLIGPRIGVKSNWLLGAGFRIFGDAAASLVYQNFKVKIKSIVPIQNQLTVQLQNVISQTIKSVNPTFDAALGFGWGSYFNNKRWHFDLTAGYEFQFFYNQNELLGEIRVSQDSSSLILQGLTIAARFDF